MDRSRIYYKSGHPTSKSAYLIKWINVLAVLLSLVIIALGIWLATRPGDCERNLLAPVFIVGAFFLFVAVLGLYGSWFAIVPVLYTYLFLMFLVLVTFLVVTIFIFVVTTPGGGYTVNGQIFKEYRLSSYSKYVQDKLSKQSNWKHVKACIEGSSNCAKFNNISPNAYLSTSLNPIQSGCCRPPSECKYPMISPGQFDTSSTSSTNPDCPKYSNNVTMRCYQCDSCKGGVAQELKQTGRVAGIVTLVTFLILVLVYIVACCASHNAAWEHYGRV